MRSFNVAFLVKGSSLNWTPTEIKIQLNDISGLQEFEVLEMAKDKAKIALIEAGYSEQTYIYKDIENI